MCGCNRNHVVVNFYLGDDEDAEGYQPVIDTIPIISSTVHFWSSRDSKGNYHKEGKTSKKFKGIVRRIEYFYEETGKASCDWGMTEHVNIFLEPMD